MLRSSVILLFLLFVSVALWFTNDQYPNTYLRNAFYTFAALAVSYFLLRFTFEQMVARGIREPRLRYSLRKTVSFIYLLSFVLIAVTVWVENTHALLVSYGVLAAGAAFALQDLLKNVAGGILIFLTGVYRVGDRIEINSKCGDVIDIGIVYTTLMETNEWVQGDQATGRLSAVPNGCVLSSTVNNYTRDHNYVWDELAIPITYDSDWKEAITTVVGVVEKETREVADQAEASISKLGEKYYLPRRALEPSLFLTLTENWIAFNIRYVTEVRQRRMLRSKLSQLLLSEIQSSERIRIASESMGIGITDLPDVRLKRA